MNIVIVDDEIDIFTLFQIKFSKKIKNNDYGFLFFENGEECWDYVKKSHLDIDIIFTDINMPKMDGLELLGLIKSSYPNIPVHIMTAYSNEDFKNRANELNAESFISKPINFKLIQDALEQLI